MEDHQITFSITFDTWETLGNCIPHGIRGYVYKALLEGLAKKLQNDPVRTLAQIVAQQWELEEFLVSKRPAKEDQ